MSGKPNEEGIVFDLDPAAYHADKEYEIPSLSGSLCKHLIAETPRHAWYASERLNPNYVSEEKDIYDRGSAAHVIALGRGAEIEIIDAPDWRTSAAKQARKVSRMVGKIPCLTKDHKELITMQAALVEQLDALEGGNPFAAGSAEVAIFWNDEFALHGKVYSIRCRALLDWLNPESENIYDLKTSAGSMNPVTWCKWRMFDVGAPYQAAFTRRGLRRLSQIGKLPRMFDADFQFLLVETKAPYCCSLVSVPSSIRQRAFEKTADEKVLEAMVTWHDCLERNEWPGYPTHVHVAEGAPQHFGSGAGAHMVTQTMDTHLQSQDMPDEAFTPIQFNKR